MEKCMVWQGDDFRAGPVGIADDFWSRFRGLMFRKQLYPGEGLLLVDCNAIHCCFMRFPIDVVYLDQDWKVLKTETVFPWHLGRSVSGTKHTLELEMGRSCGLQIGKQLEKKEYKGDE